MDRLPAQRLAPSAPLPVPALAKKGAAMDSRFQKRVVFLAAYLVFAHFCIQRKNTDEEIAAMRAARRGGTDSAELRAYARSLRDGQ